MVPWKLLVYRTVVNDHANSRRNAFNDDFVVDSCTRAKTRVGQRLFITPLSSGIRSTLAAAYKHEERPMRGARMHRN